MCVCVGGGGGGGEQAKREGHLYKIEKSDMLFDIYLSSIKYFINKI